MMNGSSRVASGMQLRQRAKKPQDQNVLLLLTSRPTETRLARQPQFQLNGMESPVN